MYRRTNCLPDTIKAPRQGFGIERLLRWRRSGRWQVKAASSNTIKQRDVSRGTQCTSNDKVGKREFVSLKMERTTLCCVDAEEEKRRRHRSR
jgi:hypothetical protein